MGHSDYKGIEVSALAIQAIFEGFQASSTLASKLLLDEGLGEVGPDGQVRIERSGWYPLDRCLRVIEQISANLGDLVLYQIGLTVAESAVYPEWVKDIHDAIGSIDAAYHASHRREGQPSLDPVTGGLMEELGHYGCERVVGKSQIRSVVSSPYPCAFDRGLLSARARRFQENAWVFHDDTRPCRKKGQENCTYLITWV